MRSAVWLLAGLAAVSASGGATSVIHAAQGWAALDRGALCEARARSVLAAPKGKVHASAGFAFSADRRRWGEFSAHLSRMPRPGSSLLLKVGGQPFMLAVRETGGNASPALRVELVRPRGEVGVSRNQGIGPVTRSAEWNPVDRHNAARTNARVRRDSQRPEEKTRCARRVFPNRRTSGVNRCSAWSQQP